MKKLYLVLLILSTPFLFSQVGIGTSTPNGASMLDIQSSDKGILIPRLSETERDTNLADNDINTVPPAGVFNAELEVGTLIFNTTTSGFQFWDGELWRQFFVATSSVAGNDGVVRIDGGAAGVKPSISLSAAGNNYGPRALVTYTTPLTFAPNPVTSWPETTPDVGDMTPNIYINGKFRENPIYGQVHIWRLIVSISAGSSSTGSLMAIIKNEDSGFEINDIKLIPSGSNGGNILTFYFYTVADSASLDPGRGYSLYLTSNKDLTAEIESFTRISLFKD